jgi:hypothetical protein
MWPANMLPNVEAPSNEYINVIIFKIEKHFSEEVESNINDL